MAQRVKPIYDASGGTTYVSRLQIQMAIEESTDLEWLCSDIPHWFSPENVELDLMISIKPLSDTKWFFNEPRVYLETIVERQGLAKNYSSTWVQALRNAGFSIQQDAIGVMSDEGCHRLLNDLAQESKDLLVIGSSIPASGFSLCLARHAPCSVLLLRTPLKSRIGRLVAMLATDGTEAAILAAGKLSDLVQNNHLSVVVVMVQEPSYAENAVLAPFVNIPAMEEAMEENAIMILDITRTLLEEKGIQVLDCVRLTGSPTQELLQLAQDKIEPDLIVVGAHNRPAISNWLLGSVSQRLLHDAAYNLMIVR